MTNIHFNSWIILLILNFNLTSNISLCAEDWKRTTGPFGGTIRTVAVTPKGTILAGGTNGIVYRSTNEGTSWTESGSFNYEVRCFVNTKTHGMFVTGDRGFIYSSTDDGISWNSIVGFIPTLGVYSLAVNDSGYMFAGTSDGFFHSNNFGATWTKDTTIISTVTAIVIYPTDSVFVLTYNGAYVSKNRDLKWGKISSINGRCFSMNFNGEFYATSNVGLVRSFDFGRTWSALPNISLLYVGALHHDSLGNLYIGAWKTGILRIKYNSSIPETLGLSGNECASIVSSNPSTLYAATVRGSMYSSNDSGTTWMRRNNGIAGVSVWRFSHPSSAIMYACSYMDGVFRSTDDGYSWNSIGLEGKRLWAVEGSGDSTVFAVTDSGLFRSTDIGSTWTYNRNARTEYSTLTSNKNGIVFLTTETGVARTTDGGGKWTDLPGVTPRYVYCNNDERLFAFGYAGIQYSTDNGETWTYQNFPQSLNGSLCLAAHGNDLLFGTNEGLLRSSNMGLSWIDTVYNNGAVLTAVITKEGRYFTATQFNGVSEYDKATSKWKEIGQILPSQWVHSITLNSQGNLLAATEGMGVFRTVSLVSSVENARTVRPTAFAVSQNYPNPFNPSTTISFILPTSSYVSLKIFDVLGKEVGSLVSENLSAGTYSRLWNAAKMASGVYFYRLQAGAFAETKKLMLVR
ncbi:MAG: T9SS type A sorting domain-containing protein [Bacteroidota bacterium]|nr:T9SS type A sorting domain-containing protein [Bacteroidota bacterium]